MRALVYFAAAFFSSIGAAAVASEDIDNLSLARWGILLCGAAAAGFSALKALHDHTEKKK